MCSMGWGVVWHGPHTPGEAIGKAHRWQWVWFRGSKDWQLLQMWVWVESLGKPHSWHDGATRFFEKPNCSIWGCLVFMHLVVRGALQLTRQRWQVP